MYRIRRGSRRRSVVGEIRAPSLKGILRAVEQDGRRAPAVTFQLGDNAPIDLPRPGLFGRQAARSGKPNAGFDQRHRVRLHEMEPSLPSGLELVL